MLWPADIARFCAMLRLTYIEGQIQGGESVVWFRTEKGEKICYRPEDIRRTLENKKHER